MDNKRYTLEEKIKFLDALEKKGTVASAARSMGIHNDDVCYRWVRKKDELRAAYSLSQKPGKPVKQVRRRGSKIPLQDKIQCIMAIDGGMSIHRASVEFNKNLASVQSWYRSKEELLACKRIFVAHIDKKGNEMDYKSGWSCKPVWLQSLKKCLQIELLSTRKCLL